MMKNKFRERSPMRTCNKSYARYNSYKPYLAADFFNRCGYTDCPDFWFGGQGNFHIDHFIPWKNHPTQPTLKTNYQNLVYCCSYVNILKSNDESNYIDPCNIDFNTHFYRDNLGRIIPNHDSIPALYMYKKLKLYMKRYEVIWMLDNIFRKMDALKSLIEHEKNISHRDDLRLTMSDLACMMLQYKKYLSRNQ